MKDFNYVIKDEQGIHARPAGLFVKMAGTFSCNVFIEKDGRKVDAKRIMGVMSLGVKQGQTIGISCEGEQEEEAAEALKAFLEENL